MATVRSLFADLNNTTAVLSDILVHDIVELGHDGPELPEAATKIREALELLRVASSAVEALRDRLA